MDDQAIFNSYAFRVSSVKMQQQAMNNQQA